MTAMSWTPGFSIPTPNPGDDVDQEGGGDGSMLPEQLDGLVTDAELATALEDRVTDDGLATAIEDFVTGDGITHIEAITQAAYDALGTPVATTLYVITG